MRDRLSPQDAGSMNTPTPFPSLAYTTPEAVYIPPDPLARAMAAVTEPGARRVAPANAPLWEMVKWPLRKALLGVYLATQAARRHRLVSLALVVCVALLALTGVGFAIHAMSAPAPRVARAGIDQPALPALPASVAAYLHGQRTFNGAEMWSTLDPAARAADKAGKGSEASLQQALDQERAQGLQITRYVYSGGYQPGGGPAHYTIEVDYTQAGAHGSHTWFFTVDSAGLISGVNSL